jgi:hypothetical protein
MSNIGVAPVDTSTSVGLVRVLLGDTDPVNVEDGVGEYLYFSDTEIEALVGLYDNNPKLAAARALETIAASQALLLKSWSSDDLTVRGDAIAEALRKLADQLRKEAGASEASDLFNLIPFSTCGCCEEYAECQRWC